MSYGGRYSKNNHNSNHNSGSGHNRDSHQNYDYDRDYDSGYDYDRGRGHNQSHGRPSHGGKPPRSGGMTVMITLAVILVVVLAGLIGVVVFKGTMNKQLQNTQPTETEAVTLPSVETTAPAETEAVTTEPETEPTTLPYKESGLDIINILIIGNSAREFEAEESALLADTMMLATVNKNTKTLTLTSFLRDTYAQLPAFNTPSGRQRINVCYHLGNRYGGKAMAMEKTNECLNINFGINVDYDVEIDFNAFVKAIDMLGGITMPVSEEEAAYLNNDPNYVTYPIEASESTWLDGMAALSYARMRHSNAGDSDIKRTARQRALVSKIVKRLTQRSFTELMDMANELLPYITTNMTDDEITTCLWEILPLLPQLTIESGSCPVQGSYWSKEIIIDEENGTVAYVLDFDKGQNTKYMTAITEGAAS